MYGDDEFDPPDPPTAIETLTVIMRTAAILVWIAVVLQWLGNSLQP